MHTIIPAPQRTRAQHLTEGFIFAALLFACAALAWRNPANRFILALLALVVIVAFVLCLFCDRCAAPLRIGIDRDTIRITRHRYWRLRPQTRDYPLRLFSGVGSYVRADAFGNAALFAVLLPQLPGQPPLRLGCHLLSLREEPSDLLAARLLRDDAYHCLVFTPPVAALLFLVVPIAAALLLVWQLVPPALRALRSGQYPPPGGKTLVRTRIRHGRAARVSLWLELVLIPLWALFLLAGSVPALYQAAGRPCPAAVGQTPP